DNSINVGEYLRRRFAHIRSDNAEGGMGRDVLPKPPGVDCPNPVACHQQHGNKCGADVPACSCYEYLFTHVKSAFSSCSATTSQVRSGRPGQSGKRSNLSGSASETAMSPLVLARRLPAGD